MYWWVLSFVLTFRGPSLCSFFHWVRWLILSCEYDFMIPVTTASHFVLQVGTSNQNVSHIQVHHWNQLINTFLLLRGVILGYSICYFASVPALLPHACYQCCIHSAVKWISNNCFIAWPYLLAAFMVIGCCNQSWSSLLYPPHNEVVGGVYWFHSVRPSVCPSVRPSVPHAVSALYHLQLWMDSFHIRHKWSLPWEGVSCTMTFDLDLYLQGHLALT